MDPRLAPRPLLPVPVPMLWLALASLLAWCAPQPALGQSNSAVRVYRDQVEPHWFASSSAFWYRAESRSGTHEFVVVTTDPATRFPAFHHSRLAHALQSASGQPIDPARLPFDTLDFHTNAPVVTLRGEFGTWRLNLDSYSVEADTEAGTADSLPAELEPRPSRAGTTESAITFENRLDRPVGLFWISPEGQRVPYGTLSPGASRRQHTFAGHVWLVAEGSRTLAVFEAERRPRRAIVPSPTAPQPRAPRGNRGSPSPAPPAVVPSPEGGRVAFVRNHNLWIRSSVSNVETQLSFDGNPGHSFRKDVQRDRLVGMEYEAPEPPATLPEVFWSPDGRYVVALQTRAVPERRVALIESSPADQLQPKSQSYPYLKAGDDLPTQRPRLFAVDPARELLFPADLFPNPWSVDEFRWETNSTRFTFLYNQRGHQLLRVVAVEPATDDPHRAHARTLVEDQRETFIDYSNKTFLRFVDAGRQCLWMTERSGWNHLVRVNTDHAAAPEVHEITRGEFVVRRVEHVDESLRQIWLHVMGLRPGEDPYHVHLARVNFDGSGFTLLTEGDGTHSIQWSPDRRHFLDTWSRADQPPITELRRANDGARLSGVEVADASEILERRGRFPERFSAPGRDGATLIYGLIHRPANFDPSRRYPVLENIYAGPHDQHVPKAFRASYRHQQELADRGFIVVQIDGMGTNWRSKKFHDVAARNLGDAGFPDRIAWLRAAAARFPEFDLSRVGIYGGSAGGQNALRALLAHGDFYQAAVADCGCHDNRMDKIWWNEAWMGWPVGPHYAEQSNVTQAHRLQGKLLLVVGELDRNVDPASTTQVVHALIKADKNFDFLLVPGTGHGAAETDYGRRRRAEFFQRHLQ
ncbi:MAG: prolyl oligopeptidase family serine peptidase [Verrucomicrobiales bacterium]|nr:prolyl oligopeptidase family serine peptidase [Verrucomicrobiales bacterium]